MKVKFKSWLCNLRWGQYGHGKPAITLIDDKTGEPVAVASINLQDYPEHKLPPNHIHIKDYSENEGMVDALVEAGVVEEIQSFGIGRHSVKCTLCKLLIEVER
jgi:hypothetical protein